jgi:hypothetical protein
MIKVSVGDSTAAVWETPDGTKARVRLVANYGRMVNLDALLVELPIEIHPGFLERPASLGLATLLEMLADSASALARELRERKT